MVAQEAFFFIYAQYFFDLVLYMFDNAIRGYNTS